MMIELKPHTDRFAFIERLKWMGLEALVVGEHRLIIVRGVDKNVHLERFIALPEVAAVLPVKEKFKLASKAVKGQTIIQIKGKTIGGSELFIIAGPCSIESKEQMDFCAELAHAQGAGGLRGGAFKPRTSPYEFQGMGEEGLKILRDAGAKYNLVTVSEVMDASQIDMVASYVDILQVGARNMHNFSLLKELGRVKNPILLKRGFAASYQDLLLAAEYIISAGNPNVILCERGIRTFETHTRNTLDLNAVPALKELTHLPILVDPSHGTGRRSMVLPMARASIAAGADGLAVEVHPNPDRALTDAAQTIGPEAFAVMMREVRKIHSCLEA
ncbi:MAG: 3-deoxy-7-phosphoheptulonate synthase [Verrucomicrobia bacterium]|nr:3-deoxy-7-phosphoheptulonate synthase [Verrucomicrobiota bacterium]MBU6446478.1 3-deoxy-7-phosphoheptulonate synthase [Verrucomicrobiota bacterium]MDE3047235.1 3-deoxy-7-phosphoheptulonate synthase [Verrucomicrobiota bacterium]